MSLDVVVENVGGIERATLTLEPGATLLTGPNASNKSSLLRALSFAVGREAVPLRDGSDAGRVRIEGDGIAVDRRLRRGDGETPEGESLLETAELPGTPADYVPFVGLLEFNPLRAAVRRGESVEALLTAPVDVDELERRRAEKLARKRELDDRIDELEGATDRLADRREELAEARRRRDRLEETLERLRGRRSDPSEPETDDLERERASLATERDELAAEVEELAAAVDRLEGERREAAEAVETAAETVASYDPDRLRERLRETRAELDEIEERVDTLRTVLTANREMIDAGVDLDPVGRERSLAGDRRRCWACGETVEASAFADALDRLESLLADHRERRREAEPRVEEIEAELEEYRSAKRRLEAARERERDLAETLSRRRDSLETKRDRLAELREEIRAVDDRIEAERRERAAVDEDLAAEIDSVREDLYDARATVDELETAVETAEEAVEEVERLREERETVDETVRELTDRIERTERELLSAFNDAMDRLVDLLAFDSIERIRLNGEFEVVVAREVDGAVRRSPVAHLSESERETVGLVLGLAGYLAYDLDEAAPVLVLDSLGAFDADRLATLIDFFADRARYLPVAVYPELGERLPFPTRPTPELTEP